VFHGDRIGELIFRPPIDDAWRLSMDQENVTSDTPEDATKATPEQRELQEKLDHKDDDPDAPARTQTHHQIPDEN